MFTFLINRIKKTGWGLRVFPIQQSAWALWTGFSDIQNAFILSSSSTMCFWKAELEIDFRVSCYLLGPTVSVSAHEGIHGPPHADTSSVQTDRSCLPIPTNASVNSSHFLGQNHQDLNILRWLPCGTEHPISLTFPVIRKWWKIIFHIKAPVFLRTRATMATLAETASLGCIIKAWILRAFSLSLPSN